MGGGAIGGAAGGTGGAMGGAATGAAVGSAVPGIGTALGAIIGGILGGAGGNAAGQAAGSALTTGEANVDPFGVGLSGIGGGLTGGLGGFGDVSGGVADDILMGGTGADSLDDLAATTTAANPLDDITTPMTEANIAADPGSYDRLMRPHAIGLNDMRMASSFGDTATQPFAPPPSPVDTSFAHAAAEGSGALPEPSWWESLSKGYKNLTPIERVQLGLAGGSVAGGLGTSIGSMRRPPAPIGVNLPQGSGASPQPTAPAAMASLTQEMAQRRGQGKLI